jgi:tetratricopeptide (TPR) repeat protein
MDASTPQYEPDRQAFFPTRFERHKGGSVLHDRAEEAPPSVDEAAIISDFQKGMALLEQGKRRKALAVFADLAHSERPFEEKHKHLFNDFAIQLRKHNLHQEAIAFYDKALELSVSCEDENLHVNLARALYAEKQYTECVRHLFDALRIAPGHRVARDLLVWLEQQNIAPVHAAEGATFMQPDCGAQ